MSALNQIKVTNDSQSTRNFLLFLKPSHDISEIHGDLIHGDTQSVLLIMLNWNRINMCT